MKFRLSHLLILPVLLLISGCDPSNRADFDKLFSPVNLPYLKPGKMMLVTSHDTTGGGNDRISVLPGKSASILHVSGPGVITRIWFRVESTDPYYLRRILLKIRWDDEESPSVLVPIGDFFGNGFQYTAYSTAYLSMTGGGFSCFFPMPFEASADIEIVNQTGAMIPSLSYQINYLKTDGYLGRDVGYFHASWHRNPRTDSDSDFTILHVRGKGHVVGLSLNVQSYDSSFSFLQGNERVFVDGEKNPSLFGTGMEDYFSSSQGFLSGEFSGPYNGLLYKDDSLGRLAAYRYLIYDPIPFRKSILFLLEHGAGNRDVIDIASTVFWYQLELHTEFPPMPGPGDRIPLRIVPPPSLIEAEGIPITEGASGTAVRKMTGQGLEWSGAAQLELNGKPGEAFSLQLPAMKEKKGTIGIYFSRGPDYGNYSVFLEDQKVGALTGYHPWLIPAGKIEVPFEFPAGTRARIKFVADGRDTRSTGFKAGIDGFEFIPIRSYIADWYLAGPFPLTGTRQGEKRAMDSLFAPEVSVDLKGVIPGLQGKENRWRHCTTPGTGLTDLSVLSPSGRMAGYAVTYIFSPKNQEMTLLIGSSDSGKVIFNNRERLLFVGKHPAYPDRAEVKLEAKTGWNKLLIKIVSRGGRPGFFARLRETDVPVVLSADQKLTP